MSDDTVMCGSKVGVKEKRINESKTKRKTRPRVCITNACRSLSSCKYDADYFYRGSRPPGVKEQSAKSGEERGERRGEEIGDSWLKRGKIKLRVNI